MRMLSAAFRLRRRSVSAARRSSFFPWATLATLGLVFSSGDRPVVAAPPMPDRPLPVASNTATDNAATEEAPTSEVPADELPTDEVPTGEVLTDNAATDEVPTDAPSDPPSPPDASHSADSDTHPEPSALLTLVLRHTTIDLPSPQLNHHLLPPLPSLEQSELGDRIRAFTVKVWGDHSWGTGVILQQQPTAEGWDYLVVTNSHVIRDESIALQTEDGQTYETTIVLDDRQDGYDIALLQFSSDRAYEVAQIQPETTLNETTIAVGFPFEQADLTTPKNSKFHWTEGRLVHILNESLVDGYQFAYSNAIEKGMSGGPVLNLRGELIAINGLHAYPLWGNPFVYPDGRAIDPDLESLAEASSWSIPAAIVLERSADFWLAP